MLTNCRNNRVEGRGIATIHDVTISRMGRVKRNENTSLLLTRLNRDKTRIENALARCKKALESVEGYIGSLKIESLDVSQLGNVTDTYNTTAEKLDDKIIELEEKLEVITAEIDAEEARDTEKITTDELRLKASIGVFAEAEGQIQISLIYGEFLLR